MKSIQYSGLKRKKFVKRTTVEDKFSSQNILSISLPEEFTISLKNKCDQDRINKIKNAPKSRSKFISISIKNFIEKLKILLQKYPELLVRDETVDDRPCVPTSFNYGAENINDLNNVVEKCSLFYNRSEVIRLAIILYLLEKEFGELDLMSEYVRKSELTALIKYVKINGKYKLILDLDYIKKDED